MNKSLFLAVTKSIRCVLHGNLHVGAVPEADHIRAGAARGRLPSLRVQRARYARRLRLAHLYELKVCVSFALIAFFSLQSYLLCLSASLYSI